jgi:hypothetical protein
MHLSRLSGPWGEWAGFESPGLASPQNDPLPRGGPRSRRRPLPRGEASRERSLNDGRRPYAADPFGVQLESIHVELIEFPAGIRTRYQAVQRRKLLPTHESSTRVRVLLRCPARFPQPGSAAVPLLAARGLWRWRIRVSSDPPPSHPNRASTR